MKTFCFSACALLLLVGMILINAAYVRGVTDDLQQELQELPSCAQASEATRSLWARWEKAESLLVLSVSAQDITAVSDRIAELCTAAQLKDEKAFEQARALCLLAVARIHDLERFSILHIL